MKLLLTIVLGSLIGCNGLQRLVGERRAKYSVSYDTTVIGVPAARQEPYAVFSGTHQWPDGTSTNLYLVHWKGNLLDNKSLLETDIDSLGIPKYN